MVKFGGINSRVKFDRQISRLDRCTIPNVYRTHDPRLGRLDHLGTAIHDNLPGRSRDNVDLAERRPRQCGAKQQDDGHADRTTDWRWRRLDDLQRGWEKSDLVVAAPLATIRELNDFSSGCH